MANKVKKIKLVEITWLDAEGHEEGGGWVNDEMDESTPYFKTYGLLCRKSKDWIHYADTYDPYNKGWGGKARIPTGMVKEIRVIEVIKYDIEATSNPGRTHSS
jgi:hypothetical protein